VVWLLREALARREARHPRRSDSLNALSASLVTRFHHTDQVEDLYESIRLHWEAFSLGINGVWRRKSDDAQPSVRTYTHSVEDVLIIKL